MDSKYTKEPYGFDTRAIKKDGVLYAIVPFPYVQHVLDALRLYDELKERFQPLLPKEQEDVYVLSEEDSSWISKLGFSPETGNSLSSVAGTMKIYKRDGDVITHTGVPRKEFNKVLRPGPEVNFSTGAAYNRYIKGIFPPVK